ncbi:alpha/beta fold hydrolase [Streptomyces bambusae]|uniref:Alpha/beta fold hydrolase n=1 Tax=Streptomyces bambusae TaxID=1550616 RepID=A0ABS6Z9T0_9ACTN|nr:alpha/beta hydrolase [Streptomyces bambusae]MBW5483963.1 alpha/beta fold hydrolase [Streptomyces bambusae]
MPSAAVNGTDIYYELRGTGPSVLLIAGAGGDAGSFDRVAGLLADEFTVLTYDRRGNSRSPRPAGWQTTSVAEQADDAAALLTALGLAPAAVYGNSYGAVIALDLLVRHPAVVRCGVLNDPPLMSVVKNASEAEAPVRAVVEAGMAAGGPEAAVEHFMRFASGDVSWEQLDPGLRRRMLGNGETLFGVEMGKFEPYRPDDAALSGITAPARALVGQDSPDVFHEVATWLAARLGTEVLRTPGTHTPQLDHPEELVRTIRPFLAA